MIKEAIRDQFGFFVNEYEEAVLDEMGFLTRGLVKGRLESVREGIEKQFDVVMDYAEELAEGADPDVERYVEEFLEEDALYEYLESRNGDVEELLGRRMEKLAEDMVPLLESGEDDFWDAVRASYDRDEARERLFYHFNHSKVLKGFGNGMKFGGVSVPGSGRIREKVVELMEAGEARVRRCIDRELERAYGR